MIITLEREFASGGREIGRRLAETLGLAYLDREILTEVQKKTSLAIEYIEEASEKKPSSLLPIHYAISFHAYLDPNVEQSLEVYNAQKEIIQDLAGSNNCLFIGRTADFLLKDLHPFRIFVYADDNTKLARCKAQNALSKLSDKELLKQIRRIEKQRKSYYEFFTNERWGDPRNYDLMINTSDKDLDALINELVAFFKAKQA